MPRRTAVKAAGAATAEESVDTASKGKTGAQPRDQSFSAKMQMVDVDCDNLVVKVDHATTVSIPEELDQPYCCLGAVLVDESTTVRPKAFHYVSTSKIYRLFSMQLLVLDDEREALFLYAQDYDSLGTHQKGKYIVVMHLPLKLRANNYKPETEAHYWGKQELKRIKRISVAAMFDMPDLDAFIKNYKPFKAFNLVKSVQELRKLADVPVDGLLEKCKKAGEWRIAEYVKLNLRQAGIIDKVRTTRTDYLEKNYDRLSCKLSYLVEPFEERFKFAEKPPKPSRETPPRGAKKTAQGDSHAAVPEEPPAATSAPQPAAQPAKKPPPRTSLFAGAFAPKQARPKSRAEIMQAMCARPTKGVGTSAPPREVPAPAPAPTRNPGAPAPALPRPLAPAPASLRPSAPAPAPPRPSAPAPAPRLRATNAPEPAETECAETRPATPAPAAAAKSKKPRAPRGVADAVEPAVGPRKRKKVSGSEEEADEAVGQQDSGARKNQSKIGMQYATVNKSVLMLREALLGGGQEHDPEKVKQAFEKVFGEPKKKGTARAKASEADSVGPNGGDARGGSARAVDAEELKKLKAEQADELERVKNDLEDALQAKDAECSRKIQVAMEEAGKTVDEAKEEMHQLRLEHAAENAKLHAKIEILEQQHAKAIDDQHEAFVRGWTACEAKAGTLKTRSGAH